MYVDESGGQARVEEGSDGGGCLRRLLPLLPLVRIVAVTVVIPQRAFGWIISF